MTPQISEGKGRETDLRVLLITESTYPFRFGGVSSWCNNLIKGLPNVEFHILAIVGSPDLAPLFELPANVSAVTTVPIWGVRDALELSDVARFGDMGQARRSVDERTLADGFTQPFSGLVTALLSESADPLALADNIRALYEFFLEHDFDRSMRSAAAWEAFVAAANESFHVVAHAAGYGDAPLGVSDAVTGLHWLHHWLLPLSRRLPEADVAHATMAGAGILPAVAMKLHDGAGFVFSEHGVYLREIYLREAADEGSLFLKLLKVGFARRTSELAYAVADQISTCCDHNKRWELHNGARPGRVQTIHYGLDAAAFKAGPERAGPGPVIVWLGRIDPLKDVETLLRAAAIVHRARGDVIFRLYGSATPERAEYEAQLRALRDELGLGAVVELEGYTSDPQSAYDEADVVALTSISEGFPYATLEAMLCGKPVVATAVGGVPEQLGDCGVLVEPQDPEALAAALVGLIDDPSARQRMGACARERVQEFFKLQEKNGMHLEAYVAAAANGRTPSRGGPPGVLGTNGVAALSGEANGHLLDAIRSQVPHPVDDREIAAVLEASGVTDAVAEARYGARDTFALAGAIFSRLRGADGRAGLRHHQIAPPQSQRQSIASFAAGALMLIPAAVLLSVGHWVGPIHGWTSSTGRALLLGVVASTLLGNAFLFAIMRRGALLIGCGRWSATRKFLWRASWFALTALLCADLVAVFASAGLANVSTADAATFGLSFAALIALWILTGGLVLGRRAYDVGLATLVGVAGGVVTYYASGSGSTTHVEIALVVGYLITIAAVAARVTFVLGRPQRNGAAPRLPRVRYLVREAAPFAAYGGLMIVLVLGPNLATALHSGSAGSSNSRSVAVGMTLALVPLILTIPAAEHALRALWARMSAVLSESSIGGADGDGGGGEVLRAFWRRRSARYLALVGALSLVAVPLLWVLADAGAFSGLGVHSKGALILAFAVSLLAYLLVARAQLDLTPAVTFARPDLALRCLLAGIGAALVAAVVAFALDFVQAGPVALFVGSAVFAGSADRTSDRFLAGITLHYVGAM